MSYHFPDRSRSTALVLSRPVVGMVAPLREPGIELRVTDGDQALRLLNQALDALDLAGDWIRAAVLS